MILLLLLATTAFSIESHKFKNCEHVGFCKRHRYLASRLSDEVHEGLRFDLHYEVDPKSMETGSEVAFLVKSKHDTEWKLRGRLLVYDDEVARFTITEVEPLHPRYQVPDEDLLARKKTLTSFTSVSHSEGSSEFVYRRLRVSLQYSPLRIDVYFNEALTATLNHRSLLSFERYRSRDTQRDVLEEAEVLKIVDASEVEYQKEEGRVPADDLWQEHFREFTDNKRRGPTSVAMDVKFYGASQLYGLPERSDTINLVDTIGGQPYRLYNLDVFEYEVDSRQALYGSVAFMLAKQGSQACGMFWNNPSNTYIDISTSGSDKQAHWMSEAGVIDVFVLPATSLIELVSKFTLLTGPAALPSVASLGFHQCRWNYNDQDDTLGVVSNFDRYNLPLDFIWLDIEHTVGRRYFTWDLEKFPNPTEMQLTLAETQRNLVVIIDPHIKRDPNYAVFSEAGGKGKWRQWLCAVVPVCAGPSNSI
jgi:alpha 1,3-glucosidase